MVLRYDIILLGATGLTGKSVVKELASISKLPEYLGLSWGIAGRSTNKLNTVLTDLERAGESLLKYFIYLCLYYFGFVANFLCRYCVCRSLVCFREIL